MKLPNDRKIVQISAARRSVAKSLRDIADTCDKGKIVAHVSVVIFKNEKTGEHDPMLYCSGDISPIELVGWLAAMQERMLRKAEE